MGGVNNRGIALAWMGAFGDMQERGDTDTIEIRQPQDPAMSLMDNATAKQDELNMDDLEALFDEASESLDAATLDEDLSPSDVPRPFALDELSPADVDRAENSLDMLDEVEMDLRVELGRTRMRLEDVLRLRRGSVVMLDKLAGDPVDIFANGRLIARGEVLVMNDQFCVRITELLAATQ